MQLLKCVNCIYSLGANNVIKRFKSSNNMKKIFLDQFITLRSNIPRYHGPTAEEITKGLDLSSKTALITGANSGLGLQMCKELSARGCKVLMACRNPYAAKVASKQVAACGTSPRIYDLNLASFASVNCSANEIQKEQTKLDIVILNAAVFGLGWQLTEDALETTCQVNFLAQYYLLMHLETLLAPDARVVFISTDSHGNVKWSPEEILIPREEMISLPKEQYTSIKAYNISKLCGVLAMQHLGYRWLGSGRAVFCASPGRFLRTGLPRNWWPYELLYTIMSPFSKSLSQAAATPLFCATSPSLRGQSAQYYAECRRRPQSETASDFRLACRLHDLYTDMIDARVVRREQQWRTDTDVEAVQQPGPLGQALDHSDRLSATA